LMVSTPHAESRSAYSEPIPGTLMRSACWAHDKMSAVGMPVRLEIALLPGRDDASLRRVSVVRTLPFLKRVASR
jgi:hypothetical protein